MYSYIIVSIRTKYENCTIVCIVEVSDYEIISKKDNGTEHRLVRSVTHSCHCTIDSM